MVTFASSKLKIVPHPWVILVLFSVIQFEKRIQGKEKKVIRKLKATRNCVISNITLFDLISDVYSEEKFKENS